MTSARQSYTTTPGDLPSKKRPHSAISTDSPSIFRSSPIHDRKSTFTALFSPSISPRDLQSHPDVSSASHKILAWRLPGSQRTLGPGKRLYDTGKDDDGEQHGAKHLARVLEETDTCGALVVGRWWGGVMLGPARFGHMERCAREAVQAYRASRRGPVIAPPPAAKDTEKADEEAERKELVKELERRDESIVLLRGLLGEKKRLLASLGGGESESPERKSPAKKMEYDEMPVARLRMLDKARDGTVAFLLKQIDAVEQEVLKVQAELLADDDEADDENGLANDAPNQSRDKAEIEAGDEA